MEYRLNADGRDDIMDKKIAETIGWLKVIYVWLNNIRDEKDLQEVRTKIVNMIRDLEE